MITVRHRLKRPNIGEFIERRKFNISLVLLPIGLPGLGMATWGGKYGPWTSVNWIGLAALLLNGFVFLVCIGAIRCPRCRRSIGLTTVSPDPGDPPPDRCVHCGLSFGEPMDRYPGE
jgi:hypothetical protein